MFFPQENTEPHSFTAGEMGKTLRSGYLYSSLPVRLFLSDDYVLNFSIEPKKGCYLFVIAKWYKSCRTQMLIYLTCLHINSYWIKDDNIQIVFEGPLLVAVLWKDRIAYWWVFPHPFLTSNLQHDKAQHLCRVTWLCSKVTACCQGSLPSSPVNVSHWDHTKLVFGFLSSFISVTYSGSEASRLEKAAPQGLSGRV